MALSFIPNPDGKAFIDHIDRNKLNNSLDNLRWVSSIENNRNASLRKDCKSGIRGICFSNKKQQWRAYIQRNHLGYFETKEEAIKVRQKAEVDLFQSI